MVQYCVIYDGNCNLCVNFAQGLQKLDLKGLFKYIPMQALEKLAELGISPEDCQQGMILLDLSAPEQRWQGSEAAEKITSLLPLGDPLVELYRKIPGAKEIGDRIYAQIRDNRYQWFGSRPETYYPIGCKAQD